MNKSLKTTAQGGFTLIELIVVIVILGILAATALPKFSGLGGDARVATLNAARGSLASISAMAHGKALLAPSGTTVKFEGTTVNLVNGYPKAEQATAIAAGLDVAGAADFTLVAPSNTAGTSGPTTTATQIAIIPTALKGQANAQNCYVIYTEATTTTTGTGATAVTTITPPSITVPTTATADNCQ